jgi:branched-chain amino acid transport system ATP-binding protein
VNARGEAALLAAHGVDVVYDHVIRALNGVSLSVGAGEIVALLGANGAGKSTMLKACSSLLRAERGEVVRGSITYDGQRIDRLSADALVRRGVIQVMEGRRCFAHLSVEENLLTGAYTSRVPRPEIAGDLERVYQMFPRLAECRTTQAGYVSGGEQQMIALGRALMARPRVILLVEPSMGLAPRLVEEIFATVTRLNRDDGVTFLLAEQNATKALAAADYGYVLENGRIALEGPAEASRENADIKAFYLGLHAGE